MIYKTLHVIVLVGCVLIASIFLPKIYQSFFAKRQDYFAFNYSPVVEDFIKSHYIYGGNSKMTYRLLESNKTITQDDYINFSPFMYYRYLIRENKFPQMFNYLANDPMIIAEYTQNFKVKPGEIEQRSLDLYMLLESNPKMGLSLPDDVFRINHRIEFVDLNKNQILEEKSQLFTKALKDAGAVFPIKKAFGNPSVRKPFDEGVFLVDLNNTLFHLKMKNAKPSIKNTKINMDIKHIKIEENRRKEFYGSISTDKEIFLIGYDNYELVKLPINYDKDLSLVNLRVSPVYRNFSNLKTIDRKRILELTITNLDYSPHVHKTITMPHKTRKFVKLANELLFSFKTKYYLKKSSYVFKISTNGWLFLILNIIFIVGYIGLVKYKQKPIKYHIINIALIAISGIYALISIALFGRFLQNNSKDL